MKIAIHRNESLYAQRWVEYCKINKISFIEVNAYDNDIIEQLKDCDIFMWHHHHADSKDVKFAKQLLYSLEQSGMIVFPDFKSGWHFDDKLGQKYLFESLGISCAKSYAFYDRNEALEWAKQTNYPKVFKLRGGAGSSNVKLARTKKDAIKLINKCFNSGWKPFRGLEHFIDTIMLYNSGTVSLIDVVKSSYRLFFSPPKTKFLEKQSGYSYFQDFIENDGYDYRIEVCGDKCIALIRKCRKGDFRASGGHMDDFSKENIQSDVIKMAFEITDKINSQSCALDFVRDCNNGKLYLVENSYCYGVDDDEFIHGYWDRNAVWHNESFNGLDWIIEKIIKQYELRY